MKTSRNGKTEQGSEPAEDPVAQDLEAIKGLLVLLLMKCGAKQSEIAKAIGMSQATVSKRFGLGKARPITTVAVQEEEN